MEIKETFNFQTDSDLVRKYYSETENIKVVENTGDSKICVIYFSSNEIYYPNTSASFTNAIITRDKYEWQNNLFPGAKRHIFVRDIQKQWYIEGVNTKINSPELLLEKLKELCLGYTIYTIGSSAGGFGAILFGSMIGAARVYAFNAQMDLNLIMKDSNPQIDPLLFKHTSDIAKAKYYNISEFLDPKINYFYFQSANSEMDIAQYNSCSRKDIFTKISFSTSNHGFPFLRHDLKYVLGLSTTHLKELSHKQMHPIQFSIRIHGVLKALYLTGNAIKNRVQKKINERLHA